MVQVSSNPGEKGVWVLMGRIGSGPQEPWEAKGLFLPWGAIWQEFGRQRVERAAAKSTEEVRDFC